MSNAADIVNIGRDLLYNTGGAAIADGFSAQTPVESPETAIAKINAFDDPPAADNPASISANLTGTYDSGVVIPEFVTCNSSFASIITTDAVNVECLGRHSVDWGSLLNLADDGICLKMDGVSRIAPTVNAIVPLGLNGVGIEVSGECDDIFPEFVEGELRGVGATMFKHRARSPSPIIYTAENIEFFNTGQTIIDYDPLPGGSETVFNLSTCQPDQPAMTFDTSGSTIIDAKSGIAVVDGDVLAAETLAIVRDGAQITLRTQAAAGNTIIESGGGAIYNGIGILTGNIETQGTGTILASMCQMTGDANIGAGSTAFLNADILFGDLNVDGTLFVNIAAHIGQITGTGDIHGWLNGIPFGQARQKPEEELILLGSEFTNQDPTGLDAPMQIKFGPDMGTSENPINILADGSMQVNETGQYNTSVTFQYGRAGSGGVSRLFFRVLVDGVPRGDPVFAKLDGSGDNIPVEFNAPVDLAEGEVMTFDLTRDSSNSGNDSGGLETESAALEGLDPSPSASIRITRSRLIQE